MISEVIPDPIWFTIYELPPGVTATVLPALSTVYLMLPTVALLGALIVTAIELVLVVADVEAAFDMFTSNEFELDVEALLLTVTAP